MFDILIWLGHAYQAYRAAEDSGIWLVRLNVETFQNYMESSLIAQGRL